MFVLRLRSASVEIDEKKASWHDYVMWLANGLPLTRQLFAENYAIGRNGWSGANWSKISYVQALQMCPFMTAVLVQDSRSAVRMK